MKTVNSFTIELGQEDGMWILNPETPIFEVVGTAWEDSTDGPDGGDMYYNKLDISEIRFIDNSKKGYSVLKHSTFSAPFFDSITNILYDFWDEIYLQEPDGVEWEPQLY